MKKYSIYRWLFFGGADRQVATTMIEGAAKLLCDKLNKGNGDNTYSGYYIQEEV